MPGVLTRAQMEQVIREGGSVLHGGQLINRVEQLPSAADLARGDPGQETAAANALQQQIADLRAQLDSLTAAGGGHGAVVSGAAGGPTNESTEHPFVEVFGQQIADRLTQAGYDSPEKLKAASDEQLLSIEGIGDGTLKKIRATYKG